MKFFTQVDPRADLYPGWSPYAYALNNPIKYNDPDGQLASDPQQPEITEDNTDPFNAVYVGSGPTTAQQVGQEAAYVGASVFTKC